MLVCFRVGSYLAAYGGCGKTDMMHHQRDAGTDCVEYVWIGSSDSGQMCEIGCPFVYLSASVSVL